MTGTVLKLNVTKLPALNRVDEVTRELTSRIRSGELQPQMRLPSKQTMAAEFGVSRTVIPEAIARLKNERLVSTRQGSGAFVPGWDEELAQSRRACEPRQRSAARDFARQMESEHPDIVQAIRRKDSSAARLAAQLHIDQARIRIAKAGRDILPNSDKLLEHPAQMTANK